MSKIYYLVIEDSIVSAGFKNIWNQYSQIKKTYDTAYDYILGLDLNKYDRLYVVLDRDLGDLHKRDGVDLFFLIKNKFKHQSFIVNFSSDPLGFNQAVIDRQSDHDANAWCFDFYVTNKNVIHAIEWINRHVSTSSSATLNTAIECIRSAAHNSSKKTPVEIVPLATKPSCFTRYFCCFRAAHVQNVRKVSPASILLNH